MKYPILPFNSFGKSNLCWWENFLSDEDINYILSRPEWHNSSTAQVGYGADHQIHTETRQSNVSWMDVDAKNEHIWQKITYAIWQVNAKFFHFDLTGCYESAQLTSYKEHDQGHYNWHQDSGLEGGPSAFRKLSMSLLLSDPSEFEGGELQTMSSGTDEKETLEQKKGRAWFFPSWTLHRVTPVTKGIRRTLVLWVGGPAFK